MISISVRFVLAAMVMCSVLLFNSGVKSSPSLQETENKDLSAGQLLKAKSLFKEKCARCHGEDGRAQTVIGQILNPPDFTDKKWSKPDIDADKLSGIVGKGKGEMPAFGKKLTRQEIDRLIVYIRMFSKPNVSRTNNQ